MEHSSSSEKYIIKPNGWSGTAALALVVFGAYDSYPAYSKPDADFSAVVSTTGQ